MKIKCSIMLSKCCVCGKIYGFKNGKGCWSFSHGYCKKCAEKVMKNLFPIIEKREEER